ncbi:MAG: beta-propeller domain-containing protein, partial [Clostridia bacterium]|nr:beta-propeller domain-containing protein [Clostridia bacterium]
MKREEHDVLHYAEERYIEEADPAKMVSGKRSRRGVYIALAACLALLLVVGVLIGTPFMKKYMEGLKYKDSAYALLIARLDVLKTKHEEDLTKGEDWVDKEEAMSEPAGDLEPEIGEGNYEEVTDNQVSGVIEGDRFKRSDRYIYYLDDETLYVYSIEGEDSKKVGWYHLPEGEKGERIMAQGELYLSKDCTTVTLFYSLLNTQSYERSVQILSLDVR